MQPTRATYVWTFGALLLLSGLTLGLSFLPLGAFGPVVAMAIATAKATLIALFFMHLVEQRPVNALVFLVPVVLVALFVGIAVGEVATRDAHLGEAPVARAGPGSP